MISRRSFLAALPALLLLRPEESLAFNSPGQNVDLLPQASWFADPRAVRQLGLRVLDNGVSRSQERESLLGTMMNLYQQQGENECRQWVAKAMNEDFAHERVCIVDGWVLSQTEAHLSALWAGS